MSQGNKVLLYLFQMQDPVMKAGYLNNDAATRISQNTTGKWPMSN